MSASPVILAALQYIAFLVRVVETRQFLQEESDEQLKHRQFQPETLNRTG